VFRQSQTRRFLNFYSPMELEKTLVDTSRQNSESYIAKGGWLSKLILMSIWTGLAGTVDNQYLNLPFHCS